MCTCETRPEVLGVPIGHLNNRRFHVRHARCQEQHQREGEHLEQIRADPVVREETTVRVGVAATHAQEFSGGRHQSWPGCKNESRRANRERSRLYAGKVMHESSSIMVVGWCNAEINLQQAVFFRQPGVLYYPILPLAKDVQYNSSVT